MLFAESSVVETAVNGILSSSESALGSLVASALPIVSALIVSGLTIWGGYRLVRLMMHAFEVGDPSDVGDKFSYSGFEELDPPTD